METRKRTASDRPSASTEVTGSGASSAQKQAKLVLKPPKFITEAKAKKPTVQPSFSSLLEAVLELETHDEALEQLLQINKQNEAVLSRAGEADMTSSVKVIGRLWKKLESSIPVCTVLVRTLVLVARRVKEFAYEVGLHGSIQTLGLSMAEHECIEVKVCALKCLQEISDYFKSKVPFIEKVLELSRKQIHHIHHGVRVECLKLIGLLSHVTDDTEIPLSILEDNCHDADPRVRTAAFQALYQMHRSGCKLPLSVYSKASDALTDDSEDVRTSAVRMVWALAILNQDKVVPLKREQSVEIRMLDDGFVKICDLLNDSSMLVRALAASLLGDFKSVSSKFLEQTLDKKLMSHLKVVKSDHERQLERHQAGGGGGGGGGGSMDWDSGRKWGAAAPKMELDPGEISLMSAGACGAFVHGLEDEFMEVRSATVGSMCRLCVNSPSFAMQSLDYLVDMFNDEIETVRLKAINSLRQISANMELREDQLESVLSILEESSGEIRDALRGLLCSCRITTSGGLNTTIHALLDNLKKYPTDRESIWKCLKQLGNNHGSLVSILVPELLSTHPFFMGKEPDVDDPAYICILILVFNAAVRCHTIPPLFPQHVFRHYAYLRDTLPDLVPAIRIGMPQVTKLSYQTLSSGHTDSKSFLSQVLSRAQLATKLHSGSQSQKTWHTCITDLERVAELNKKLSSLANCTATFLQCQLLLSKIGELLSQDVLLTSEGSGQNSFSNITGNIRELLLLSYRLEYGFTGLSPQLLLKCRLVRVAAHAMSLLLAVHLDYDTERSGVFSSMKQALHNRLDGFKSFCSRHDLEIPSVLTQLLELNLAIAPTEAITYSMQPLISAHFCTELPLGDLQVVRQCRAELHEPQDVSRDDFTKFVSTLALSTHVNASLTNVDEYDRIAIQARFPDGHRLLFPVKCSEVRDVGVAEAKLDTSVVLSHGIWTDPCQVEFCVVKTFPSDVASESSCFQLLTTSSSSSSSFSATTDPSSKSSSTYRPLPSSSLHGSHSRSNFTHHHHHHHQSSGHMTSGYHGNRSLAFPEFANPIHSHREDGLEEGRCVLAIGGVVKVNIHPQEKANNSFNVFSNV